MNLKRAAIFAFVFAFGGMAALSWARTRWIDRKIVAATQSAHLSLDVPDCTKASSNSIIIIGDSRVSQWPMHLFGDRPVQNLGRAGETALHLMARFQLMLAACHPRTVLIASGINDLIAASFMNETDARKTIIQVGNTLIGLAQHAAAAGIDVYVSTVIPPARPSALRRLAWSWSIVDYVQEVNERLRHHTWEAPTVLVDFASRLDPDGTGLISDAFRRDTIHLNMTAYDCLTRMFLFSHMPQ